MRNTNLDLEVPHLLCSKFLELKNTAVYDANHTPVVFALEYSN
jgi:hypothetical protein